MPEHEGHQGRTIYERVGALEQDMAVARDNIDRFERIHEATPGRITRLEEQFNYQNRQLQVIGETQLAMNTKQSEMSQKLDKIGGKLAQGLAVGCALWAVLQLVGPTLLKVLVSP